MKGKMIIMGVIMIMAVMGTSLAVMASDANTAKAEPEQEFQVPEEKLIRNREGKIVGIDGTDEPVSPQYQDVDYEQLISSDQFREYEELGLTRDDETKTLYFYGMEVQYLSDEYEEGNALQYLTEKWGEDSDYPGIDLVTVRNENYQLLYFKFYKEPLYNEYLYNLEDEEYGIEDQMWEDEGIAVDELSETDEEVESIAIIGGADGSTSIVLDGISEDKNEAVNREEQIRNLYNSKTSDAKDDQAISSIIHQLFVMGLMPASDMIHFVETEDTDLSLVIQFESPLPDTDETILKLSDCGNIFLALVDELSEVRFTYPADREEKMQFTLYWDKQAANESLERDVKAYGKTLDEFEKLFQIQ